MLLDLHVHSCFSKDSVSQPVDLVKKAAEKGFGFAVTDHDNCSGWQDFIDLAGEYKVPLVLGIEIKVFREKKMLGEILALFLKKPVVAKDFFEAVSLVHEQGGIVAAAHPFDLMRKPFMRGFDELPRLKKHFDAVEVFNSRTIVKKFDSRAKKFAKENSLPMICGSDAHTVEELGTSLTEVRAKTVEEARKEILAGRTRLHCRKSSLFVHSYSTMAKFGLKKEEKK
jgi:hypothetical protein